MTSTSRARILRSSPALPPRGILHVTPDGVTTLQAAMAQKQRERQGAAAERERRRLEQEMRRAHAAAVAARERLARADARAAAQAEREAERLHVESQQAKVESLNADLRDELEAIDSILESALAVDDYVDLEKLRRVAEHPQFTSVHSRVLPPPPPIAAPPEPYFRPPAAPTGISAVFAKKKHAAATAGAQAQFEQVHAAWRAEVAQIPGRQRVAKAIASNSDVDFSYSSTRQGETSSSLTTRSCFNRSESTSTTTRSRTLSSTKRRWWRSVRKSRT